MLEVAIKLDRLMARERQAYRCGIMNGAGYGLIGAVANQWQASGAIVWVVTLGVLALILLAYSAFVMPPELVVTPPAPLPVPGHLPKCPCVSCRAGVR